MTQLHYRLFTLVLLLGTCGPALIPLSAQTPWTIKDILQQEGMSSVQFSADATMLVWSKRRPVTEKDKFVSDLYLTRLTVDEKGFPLTTRLTRTADSDYAAFFSRDGKYVYFLSSREKGNKLWRLSIYGGEAEAVHTFEQGISNPAWLNDTTLVFRSYDGKELRQQQREKKKDNVVVVEDTTGWRINRLYRFDLADKKITRLTENDRPVRSFTVSPDGRYLIYTLTGSPHQGADAQPASPVYLHDLSTGDRTRIVRGMQGPGGFAFTPDSRGVYFTAAQSSDPQWDGAGITLLYHFTVDDPTPRAVDLQWPLGIGGGFRLVGDKVWVSLANRATRREALYVATEKGWAREDVALGERKDHVSLLAASETGDQLVFTHSTTNDLPRYFTATLSGDSLRKIREIIRLNKGLRKKKITRSEVVEWAGWQGEMVTGLLYYPTDYEPGRAYPLMLSIHGGPAGVDLDRWSERWSTYPQLLAQKGSFVLKPNYHGSANHGLDWVESIKKNYYEPEMEDLIKGVDWLIDRGMVHPDSLGTMGWSNGAILTTMLTVRYPDRFRVACPGAGDVNWTSDYGTCAFGVSFDQSYFGGAPWDDVDGKHYNEAYITKSPLFELEKVRTPTIIFHGSEDRAVPRDQGWEYYRALQQVGKAPVRFLWFPGQPHGLGKITHQTRKMEEELRWIDTYLFGNPDTENPTFKKDSPLAALLAKDTLARSADGRFGVMRARTLVPELVVVRADSLRLGRFEVTNAQYAAFDDQHRYGATEDNHPAQVSRAQATRYLRWLSEQLGQTARLPSAAEARSLHRQATKCGPEENTLNYWAGYAITPAEVPAFRQKMMEAKTSLFMAVGSFPAVKVGKAHIYDLGGNVAEMSATGIYGYGAYDYVDAQGKGDRTDRQVGFRVVVAE